MKKVFTVILILSLLCFQMLAQQQNTYYPGQHDWSRESPELLGLNQDSIHKAVEFAKANEYSGSRDLRIATLESFAKEPYHELVGPTRKRGGAAGLILKNGYIVAEWGDLDRVDMTFSVTKSYLSTIAGIALKKGLIRSVRDTVAEYIWDETFDGVHNSTITWYDLLTQSSDWSGVLFGMHDWSDRPPSEGGIDDWKMRKLQPPGSNFEYNDVRVNVLAYSLLQVLRKPLPVVLKEEVMDPIGSSSTWRWYGYENSWVNIDGIMMQSVSGGGHNGGGIFINTYDQAKYGLLFARQGMWNNKQILPKEWIKQVQVPSSANASYGYMWWLNKGEGNWKNVPESVYYAAGFGGNYIVIFEQQDLVIITRWLQPSKIGEMVTLVLSALQ